MPGFSVEHSTTWAIPAPCITNPSNFSIPGLTNLKKINTLKIIIPSVMDFCFLKRSHNSQHQCHMAACSTCHQPATSKNKDRTKIALSWKKLCFIFFFNILESRQENGLVWKEENGKNKITRQNNTCGSKRATKWQSWDSRQGETSGLLTSFGSRAGQKPKMQNYILNIHTRKELIYFSQLSLSLSPSVLFWFVFLIKPA